MKPADCSDLAIVLSLRVDSQERVRNLSCVLDYYENFTSEAEIVIVEQGSTGTVSGDASNGIVTLRLEDDGVHWQTRNLNFGARYTERKYVLFTDADMFPHPDALKEGLKRLDAGAEFVHLHDGLVQNLPSPPDGGIEDWQAFCEDLTQIGPASIESGAASSRKVLYGNADFRATGGALLCCRKAFWRIGGYNPNFLSYGFEEQEIHFRIQSLAGGAAYLDGYNLYHFDHPRQADSHYSTFYRQNQAEFERITRMDQDTLLAYAQRGFRSIAFSEGKSFARISDEDADGWYRRRDQRSDLSDVAIFILADAELVAPRASCLEPFLDFLEERFSGYQVVLCETAQSQFKYPQNRTNLLYCNLRDAAEIPATDRPLQYRVTLKPEAEQQLAELQRTFTLVELGQSKSEVFLKTPQISKPVTGNHAIYISFDNDFVPFAIALLQSIRSNFPNHPNILLDYSGSDAKIGKLQTYLGATRLPPVAMPEFANNVLHWRTGQASLQRLKLWRREFDAYDSILHLDADMLVLSDLSDLFAAPEPYFVANHEFQSGSSIFSQESLGDPLLRQMLEEDGIDYPGDPNDMANAGLFVLPRAYRSPKEMMKLARLSARYGQYFAFADQSLLSLWLLASGRRPTLNLADNFQSPFFGDANRELDLHEIRVVHFSSYRKPGTDAFRQWERLGGMNAQLEALYLSYRDKELP